MTIRVLVSGFEPFGGDTINPTEELAGAIGGESFPGAEIRSVLLPVKFDVCAEALLREVEAFRPDVVIACGLAKGRTSVTPERIAANVKDVPASSYADEAGGRPADEPIRPGGPDGLFATLPLRAIVRDLHAEGVPAAISNTAGTFICNNTMYSLLDHLASRSSRTLAGFVHFPASTEMTLASPGVPSLPMETLKHALRTIVRTTIGFAAHGER